MTTGTRLMVLAAAGAALAGLPGAHAAELPCGDSVYVTNSESDTISVISTASNAVVATLSSGDAPVNPTFTNDWKQVYFANVEDGTLSVIDTASNRIVSTIPAGAPKPSGLRFTPDGKRLVISFLGETLDTAGSLGLMDLATGQLIWRIPVGAQPERLDLTPDGKRAYVANLRAKSVSVVDLEKGEVIATVSLPETYPFNVLASPDGRDIYVGQVKGRTIAAIDTASNQMVQLYGTAEGPNGMAFTPDRKHLFVTNVYSGRVQKVNLANGDVTDGPFVGRLPGFIRLTPDGKRGYFVRPYGSFVSVIDTETMERTHSIEVGKGPSTLAICGNP